MASTTANSHTDALKGQYASTHMGWGPSFGPFTYRHLTEPSLTEELRRMSLAKVHGEIDSVSFQPCLDPFQSIQDRRVVEKWDIAGGVWTFTAVFDGHGGHDCVNFISETLPSLVHKSLTAEIKKASHSAPLLSTTVSAVLSSSIRNIDDRLTEDLLSLFPGGPHAIAQLPDHEIVRIIKHHGNPSKVLRCASGSTVLISLVDPRHENVWVASLGDCLAILGEISHENTKATVLSAYHNAKNQAEVRRVLHEHPNEPDVIQEDRVLGSLAVTRAVGDHMYKLPSVYISRVFRNASFALHSTLPARMAAHVHSPPYVSNIPSVRHLTLSPSRTHKHQSRYRATTTFLVLCSDGLCDLYEHQRLSHRETVATIVKAVERELREEAANGHKRNLALGLLKHALGDDDPTKVSRMMTVDLQERWMDDTTIIVQRL